MTCKIIRKEDATTNVWSGGSTTEYFIYPEQADYAKRDFDFRISRAVVEQTPSEFTSLPGYMRLLMPLDAKLRLVHQEQAAVSLSPLEVTSFDGGWHTVSHGVCTDFGLMYTSEYQGRLEAVESGVYTCPPGFTGIYARTDGCIIICSCEKYELQEGDFFLLDTQEKTEITLELKYGQRAVLVQAFPC